MNEITPLPIPQAYCTACAYSLHGLPPRGRCPECGHPYDDHTLILFGWPPDRVRPDPIFAVLHVAAICFAVFLWIYAGMGFVGVLFSLFALTAQWKAFVSIFFMLLMFLGYAAAGTALLYFSRWMRRKAERSINPDLLGKPTLQLHLSPQGYGMRHGFGPPPALLHWRPDLELDLTHKDKIARLRIARLSPVGTTHWSTVINLSFPATAEQVTQLKTYIDIQRSRTAL